MIKCSGGLVLSYCPICYLPGGLLIGKKGMARIIYPIVLEGVPENGPMGSLSLDPKSPTDSCSRPGGFARPAIECDLVLAIGPKSLSQFYLAFAVSCSDLAVVRLDSRS